jgi:hypothetical protein
MADVAAIHKLKPEAPTPLRIALADRIEASKAATARSAAISSAYQSADAEVYRARRALENAQAGVAQSKLDAASFLTDVARGEAGERPPTIRQARTALEDAEDELASCVAARAALRDQMSEGHPGLSDILLKEAALAVLTDERATAATALVAEVEASQGQLAERGAALEWLASETGIFPRGHYGAVTGGAAAALARMTSAPNTWGLSHEQHRERWQNWLTALMRDAGAQLP